MLKSLLVLVSLSGIFMILLAGYRMSLRARELRCSGSRIFPSILPTMASFLPLRMRRRIVRTRVREGIRTARVASIGLDCLVGEKLVA